jgi:hypothetical protein
MPRYAIMYIARTEYSKNVRLAYNFVLPHNPHISLVPLLFKHSLRGSYLQL